MQQAQVEELHQSESNPEPESLSRPPISTSEAIQSIDSLMYYMESLPVSSLDHTTFRQPLELSELASTFQQLSLALKSYQQHTRKQQTLTTWFKPTSST
ncbi:hypothetical protein BDZ91DRAFT_728610 [Kalaharituber pfeilii]|nr:hypothetical protein BDZ91DRAFT_728610 [Kalaharituber pfeilii]